jgi:hypothetical protein
LPPQLRELDAKIEQIELELRDTIEKALAQNRNLVPPHLLLKADERISRAMKKDAAFESERYEQLAGTLEYFDLRELQEMIVSKILWDRFVQKFKNKESLIAKFDQLAELRNGIRHSRAVDKITLKEGEAAILWFSQVLKK